MGLNASLILIGDEILDGRTRDTNGHWLAKRLKSEGISLNEIKIVSDDLESLTNLFKDCLDHYDVTIISGGLGPTQDDVTKLALSKCILQPLKENSKASEIITTNYERFSKEWTPHLNSYHLIPKTVEPLDNPKGLAPGLFYTHANSSLFFAPGVPWEFEAMFDQIFLPRILSLYGEKIQRKEEFSIRTRFIPEEKIFGEVCPDLWEQLSQFGKVASLPHILGIDILVRSTELTREKRQQIIKLIKNSPLDPYVWQFGNQSLCGYIIDQARLKNKTIGLAESCTGGLTASRLTDIAGSSDVFMGGLVTYSNQAKIDLLNVKEKTLEKYGAVSTQTAEEMAVGARDRLKVDYALAFSGIAGPGGGTAEKPVGTMAFALAGPSGIESKMIHYTGDRLKLKMRFSEFGFFKLLEALNA